MKFVPLTVCIVASVALSARCVAQCNPVFDLVVSVPPVVSPGVPVVVTVTNQSATCTYTLPTSCVFQRVTDIDCTGVDVANFPCLSVLTPIAPGQTLTQSWDQRDNNGAQVPYGPYGLPIVVLDPSSNLHELCRVVFVGPNCPFQPTGYGISGAGTGGVIPFITWNGELPTIGNSAFAIDIVNPVGGAPAALFIGAAGAFIAAPWGWFFVDPNPPFIEVDFVTSGSPGIAGAGSVSIPMGIPMLPSLVGLNAHMQALILDPGAAGGISHTGGLAFGICQ